MAFCVTYYRPSTCWLQILQISNFSVHECICSCETKVTSSLNTYHPCLLCVCPCRRSSRTVSPRERLHIVFSLFLLKKKSHKYKSSLATWPKLRINLFHPNGMWTMMWRITRPKGKDKESGKGCVFLQANPADTYASYLRIWTCLSSVTYDPRALRGYHQFCHMSTGSGDLGANSFLGIKTRFGCISGTPSRNLVNLILFESYLVVIQCHLGSTSDMLPYLSYKQ